ncbi:hypothetical protein MBLNU230_g8226t1 [Neophaeotheca triangularis]
MAPKAAKIEIPGERKSKRTRKAPDVFTPSKPTGVQRAKEPKKKAAPKKADAPKPKPKPKKAPAKKSALSKEVVVNEETPPSDTPSDEAVKVPGKLARKTKAAEKAGPEPSGDNKDAGEKDLPAKKASKTSKATGPAPEAEKPESAPKVAEAATPLKASAAGTAARKKEVLALAEFSGRMPSRSNSLPRKKNANKATPAKKRKSESGDRGDLPPGGLKGAKAAMKSWLNSVKDGRVGKQWRAGAAHVPGRTAVGLSSPDNRCYINALLQCFAHQPFILNYLENIHQRCVRLPAKCVVCALRQFLQAYWAKEDPQLLETEYSTLRGALLSEFPKQTVSYTDLKNSLETSGQEDPILVLAYLFDMIAVQANSLQEFNAGFGVMHRRVWTCDDCNKKHDTGDIPSLLGDGPSITVGVPIISKPKNFQLFLTDLLREVHVQEREMGCDSEQCYQAAVASSARKGTETGDNRIGGLKTRQVKNKVTSSPEILFVHLNRGQFDKKGAAIKVPRRVRYGEFLHLGEYSDQNPTLMYRLDGVVSHMGTGMKNGHYVAGVRVRGGKTFVTMDDANAPQTARGGTLEELEDPKAGFLPHMLMYSKVG